VLYNTPKKKDLVMVVKFLLRGLSKIICRRNKSQKYNITGRQSASQQRGNVRRNCTHKRKSSDCSRKVIGFNFDITHIYRVRHHKTVLSKTSLMCSNALWRFLINYSVFIVFYVRTGPTKVTLNLKNLLITMYITSLNSLDGIVLISNDWKK
jgi:hypothetical protein